jgi:hypothetical protein
LRTSYLEGVPAIHARLKDGTVVEFSGITLYGGIGSNDLAAFRAEHVGKGSRILLQGNLKSCLKFKDRTVAELITQALPVSAILGLSALLLATTVGVWLGTLRRAVRAVQHPEVSVDKHGLDAWRRDFQTRGLLEITLEETGHGITARALVPRFRRRSADRLGPCRYADLCLPMRLASRAWQRSPLGNSTIS